MRAGLQSCALHQTAHYFFRCEILRGDFARRAAIAFVIAFDRVHRRQDVFHRSEAEESLARRQRLAEAGLLSDHRAAGGQVTGAAVAEPAGTGTNVLVARDGELSARALDIAPVAIDVFRYLHRMRLAPAVLAEQSLYFLVHPGGQLEWRFTAARQVEEFFKLAILRPVIGVVAIGNVLALVMPGGDGRVRLAFAVRVVPLVPQVPQV